MYINNRNTNTVFGVSLSIKKIIIIKATTRILAYNGKNKPDFIYIYSLYFIDYSL